MSEIISEFVKKIKGLLITDGREKSEISESREPVRGLSRDIK